MGIQCAAHSGVYSRCLLRLRTDQARYSKEIEPLKKAAHDAVLGKTVSARYTAHRKFAREMVKALKSNQTNTEVCLSCPKDNCTGSCDYLHGMVMQKLKGIKYDKKVAKTQQERSYNWYEKLRSDPERYQAYLQRQREQNRKRREKRRQKPEAGGAEA